MDLSILDRLTQPIDQFDARPVVSHLLLEADRLQASDLHLSPREGRVEVSLRRDGVLRAHGELAPKVYQRLLVGLKNMAKLASYKRSVPQDGALQVEGLEVRVATAPTVFGERVVFRLLARSSEPPDLENLGFFPDELAKLKTLADRPEGLILATGPAGSGKTTTLLALMRWLYATHRERLGQDPRARLSLVTLEDPVEFVVQEFHQTAICEGMGMTFAEGLRSILRQDPEVLLVGEIRDSETARAVVQAGLSGHLVFSTVHAKDTVGVVPRLLELGVESYQLSAALVGVLAQRLVRLLCVECRGEVRMDCQECEGSGYAGRSVVAEILPVDEDFSQLILDRASLRDLRALSRGKGLNSLVDSANLRLRAALTDQQELQRVIPGFLPNLAHDSRDGHDV